MSEQKVYEAMVAGLSPTPTPETAQPRPISASGLNDLLICERRYAYARGVDPTVVKPPPGDSLTLGHAFHSAVRAFYDKADPLQAITAAVQDGQEQGGDVQLALTHAQNLFDTWQGWYRQTGFTPVVQEEELVFEVAGTPVLGYLDARDDKRIVDWKTAAAPWDKKKIAAAWLQATLYYLGVKKTIGLDLPSVSFVVASYGEKKSAVGKYGAFTKNVPGTYAVEEHVVEVTPLHVRRLEAMVRPYGPRIQSVNIEDYAINPTSFLCSEKWCDYWKVCPGGGQT